MKIHKFTIGNFAVNNYLVHTVDSPYAVLIDAGENPDVILNKIDELQLNLKYLINTHGHGDHIAGNETILQHTDAVLMIHELDSQYLSDPFLNLSAFFGMELHSPPPQKLLKDRDKIILDDLEFKILHTPGHTPGHISVCCNMHAFVGDVIFKDSIGRTDLPLASSQQLIDSIRKKIYTLPADTILNPGHGPNTTVGNEKAFNPFVSI